MPCRYFSSPSGCRYGHNCRYKHIINSQNPFVMSDNRWNKLLPPQTAHISQTLMSIGESIWFCTDCDKGEKGIVQYDINTKKYETTPYPNNLGEIGFHSCCNDEHLIYIVNGKYGNLIIFNTQTKQFVDAKIPNIGSFSTSIMIKKQLHIFNGSENNGHHIVYDPTTKGLKKYQDYDTERRIDEHI